MRSVVKVVSFLILAFLPLTGHAVVAPSPASLGTSVREVNAVQDPSHPNRGYIKRHKLTHDEVAAPMTVEVNLNMRNFADLQARVARGEQISAAEMATSYEPAAADYEATVDWLTSQGFSIVKADSHHMAIFASGSVGQFQRAFSVNFAQVTADDVDYTSAISAPSVPASLSAFVLGVNGLQPHLHPHKHALAPDLTSGAQTMGTAGLAQYTPAQIAKAYGANSLYSSSITGTGQSIAIVIDTFPAASDLTAFWKSAGVAQSLSNITLIQTVVGTLAAPSGEESLDVEWASAMAPNAKVRVYASLKLTFPDLDLAYFQVYQDVRNHPEYGLHQMSMSYGAAESDVTLGQARTDDQYFAELSAAGVTCFASSGDGGSSPSLTTNEGNGPSVQACNPASSPNVTAVGGTSLNADSSGNELGEVVWNNNNYYAGGGGISTLFAKPAWQANTGIPGTMRQVPDIACSADPYHGGMVYLAGHLTTYGGTSWACPTCAGFMALINQCRANAGMSPVGLLAPQIYPLASSATLFRDITSGNNITQASSGTSYKAGLGYDLCTGLGSMHVQALAQQLSTVSKVSMSPTPLAFGNVVSGSTKAATLTISNTGTAMLAVTGVTYPTGFQGNWTSGLIPVGGSQAITVTFAPTLLSSYAGTITVKDSTGATNTCPATGIGTLPPPPPLATTGIAASLTGTSAILAGAANPVGTAATAYFQYGTTTNYDSTSASTNVGAGLIPVPYVQSISGLTPGTIYHFRSVVTNSYSTVYGADSALTTLPAPAFGASTLATLDGTGASVNALVNANGLSTTVYFQYGTTINYTGQTSNQTISGSTAVSVGTFFNGLAADTTYHYRVVTTNVSGTFYGPDQTFESPGFTVASILSTGAAAPDVAGAVFASFGTPMTNDLNRVAFSATLTTGVGGVVAATSAGIWAHDSTGALHMIARAGNTAPGAGITNLKLSSAPAPGVLIPQLVQDSAPIKITMTNPSFATFSDPVYNHSEQVAFGANLVLGGSVTSANNSGIWSTSSGVMQMVARTGGHAPGFASGVTFASFTGLALPDQGGVLLMATLNLNAAAGITTANNLGLWEGDSAADLQLIGSTGQMFNGKIVKGFVALSNSVSQTRSFVQGSANMAYTISFTDNTTLVLKLVGDSFQIVAQPSDTAVGTAGRFSTFGSPAINANNHTAFAATLQTGNGITAANATGIWADNRVGARQLIASQGGIAPGTAGTFATLNDPVYNDHDQVAFIGNLNVATNQATTTTASGIWADNVSGTTLGLVARQGGQAPGCPTGATFNTFSQLALPNQGGVVLLSVLNVNSAAGVTAANAQGIWAVDTGGNLNLVMRAGDSYNGKTISSLSFLPTETLVGSQSRSFDLESGNLVYQVTFTDNTTTVCQVIFP